MALRRLGSTRTADFTPLGSAGQRSFELIRREARALAVLKDDEIDALARMLRPLMG